MYRKLTYGGCCRGCCGVSQANTPSVRGTQVPGVVFLKYRGGIFRTIPEKYGIFVICRPFYAPLLCEPFYNFSTLVILPVNHHDRVS